MRSERRGGGGLGAAFVLLIFVGAIVKFWVWIVAVLGAIVLFVLLWWLASGAAGPCGRAGCGARRGSGSS